MKRLRELELRLIRVETVLIVALVLLMLGLAGYNVFYRNVLVALQKHWAHSGPVVQMQDAPTPTPTPGSDEPQPEGKSEAPPSGDADGFRGGFAQGEPASDDDADGFRGDFAAGGEDDDSDDPFADLAEDDPEDEDEQEDDAGGFGGAFGKADDEPDEEDDAGGFGGGFGKAGAQPEEEHDEDEDEDEDDDPFASLPEIDKSGGALPVDDGQPQGGPPPPGSFAAWAVDFIDAIKLDWIDIFLRQLVIIVAFLGAMLATRRRKHINIDAMSRLLSGSAVRWVSMATNLLAIIVCLVLASAGLELVKVSRAHPKDLMPWADEWMFQLMFPVGFSLLALHFIVRLLEVATGHVSDDEATPSVTPPDEASKLPDVAVAEPESATADDERDEEVRS
jgi:TRAP-type C4-dicarboxylate transport system permease small subunit